MRLASEPIAPAGGDIIGLFGFIMGLSVLGIPRTMSSILPVGTSPVF
jgi:hypothetical protein